MLNRAKRKLHSERGASLIFALLLFLVCAVVGSVVLTSGTAASGRVSEMVNTDQRYYAVTSAAELFKDMINGEKVVVEKTITTTVTTDGDGNNTGSTTETVVKVNDHTYYSDSSADTASYSAWTLPEEAAIYIWECDNNLTSSASSLTGFKNTFSVASDVTDINSAIAVKAEEKIPVDADTNTVTKEIDLSLKNVSDGSASDKVYTLTLVFSADEETAEYTNSYAEDLTSTTSVTERTTYTWTLDEIKNN